MVKKRITFILLLIIFNSCGTGYHFVPNVPLKQGDVFAAWHVSFPLNQIKDLGFQFSSYYAISDKDLIGTTFYDFIIPANISYIRQNYNFRSVHQYQIHIKNIFLPRLYNPDLEINYSYTNINHNFSNNFNMGFGFYFYPEISKNYVLSSKYIGLLPTIEYSFQKKNLRISSKLNFGITKYIVGKLKNINYSSGTQKGEIRINKTEITKIERIENDKYYASGWEIYLKDGRKLNIKSREPFYSPNLYGYYIQKRNHFKSSETARNYCIYYENLKNQKMKNYQS